MIRDYVNHQKNKLREEVFGLSPKPSFTIIQVNDDPASNSYIKGKLNDALEVGIGANLIKLDSNITQDELLEHIDRINNDPHIYGVIVQMPLPKQIDPSIVKLAIKPTKDIDGFHPLSKMNPCTPKGIINFLKDRKIKIEGKTAVIIGRSDIVGKPMAKLLLKENANTVIIHSKTNERDKRKFIKMADIIVVAIGKAGFLDNSYKYKRTAVIIDVGITRTANGVCGDALPDLPVKLQTPVPGGVGLLTRLTLLENLLEAYKNGI